MSVLEIIIWSNLVELRKVIPHRIYDTEYQESLVNLSIRRVSTYVNSFDVNNQNGHVEEMEEATHQVNPVGEFCPFEIDHVLDGKRVEEF